MENCPPQVQSMVTPFMKIPHFLGGFTIWGHGTASYMGYREIPLGFNFSNNVPVYVELVSYNSTEFGVVGVPHVT